MKLPGAPKQLGKPRELLLLVQMVVALALHIGWPLFAEFRTERRKRMAKAAFNQLLRERSCSEQVLVCLKILINNYESLPDTSILASRDPSELQNACDHMVPVQRKFFLLYSTNMNVAILGSIILPGLAYIMKRMRR